MDGLPTTSIEQGHCQVGYDGLLSKHDAEVAAQVRQVDVLDVDAVDADLASLITGDALHQAGRSRTDRTEATEVAIAAASLNRMLAFGRPNYVRIA
jgi:hypothetical protein